MIQNNQLNADLVSERFQQHLCMQQYQHLFDCYRCPGVYKDFWLFNPDRAEHIIVIYKNQHYKVKILNDGIPLAPHTIYSLIKRVVATGDMLDVHIKLKRSVSFLTGLPRPDWAIERDKLNLDEFNYKNLEDIQNCLFCVCLDEAIDDSNPNKKSVKRRFSKACDRTEDSMFMQANNGAGIHHNSGNRWFDKTIQVLIGKDGFYGFCYEHSVCEALVLIRLFEYVWKRIHEELIEEYVFKQQENYEPIETDGSEVSKLEWNLTPQHEDAILRAADFFQDQVNRLQAYVVRFTDYGKEFPKHHKCSPDGYIQLALQLTYFKTHGRLTHTYESASIRRFIKGRVDNIRAAHLEALEWVQAMQSQEFDLEERLERFEKALSKQSQLITQNITGNGLDNHMIAIRVLGEQSGNVLPFIFEDHSYAQWNYFKLSTSQVPTKEDFFMGYGPVVPDGYGCSYNPHPQDITFVISGFRDSEESDVDSFRTNLIHSLRQMAELILYRDADN